MKQYQVTMPDGTVWGVSVDVIAKSHAEYYAQYETGGDVEKCFNEHSLPLLLENPSEVWEWAAGNMNWSDVEAVAQLVSGVGSSTAADYQDGWVNGPHAVVPSWMAGPEQSETTGHESGKPPAPAGTQVIEGWVSSAVALPCLSLIPQARHGKVEVAELYPGGEWEFGYRLAVNLEHCERVKMFWRYLPDAPEAHG
jgi:hypothetical protein